MSGINQHFLPQFLLKGFASRTVGDQCYTLVFWKDKRVFEPNIKKFCAEGYFYGKPGDSTLDERITDLEPKYAMLLDELKQIDNERIKDVNVAEFVTHVCVRTKYLRDSFAYSSNVLMDKISERLSDEKALRSFVLDNPRVIAGAVDELMARLDLPPTYRTLMRQLVTGLAPEVFDSDFKVLVDSLIKPMRPMIPQAVKNGHINALEKTLAPEERLDEYKRLNWFVCTTKGNTILGDLAVLMETDGPRRFKAISDRGDVIRNIVLPVSKDRIIVGTPLANPRLEFELNEEVAKSSREFFVSSHESPEMNTLHNLIGKQPGIIDDDELNKILDEAFSRNAANTEE